MVTLQKKSPHKITLLIHKKIVFIYCFLLRWSLAGRCKLTFWKFYSVDSKVHLLLCFPKKNRDISPFLQDGSLPPMVIYYWSLFSACCMLYSLVRDCLTSIHIKARKCVFFLLKAYYEKKVHNVIIVWDALVQLQCQLAGCDFLCVWYSLCVMPCVAACIYMSVP